jgi:mannose/fructose/N-acetylgalactosamine-specific phosphotransferase system component IID
MRNFIYKYNRSKFRCFLNGLWFAILSVAAMLFCVYYLRDKTAATIEILISFGLSILSMLMGFISMFRTVPRTN